MNDLDELWEILYLCTTPLYRGGSLYRVASKPNGCKNIPTSSIELRFKIRLLECSSNEATLYGSNLPHYNTVKTTLQEGHALWPRNPIYFAFKFNLIQFDFQFFENFLKSHFFHSDKKWTISHCFSSINNFIWIEIGEVNLLISTGDGRRSFYPCGYKEA